MSRPVVARSFGSFDDQSLRRSSHIAQDQRYRGLRDAFGLDHYVARRREPLTDLPADPLEIAHWPYFLMRFDVKAAPE
jgi:hypothetical protein